MKYLKRNFISFIYSIYHTIMKQHLRRDGDCFIRRDSIQAKFKCIFLYCLVYLTTK